MSAPTVVQRLPQIQWVRDLSGATASTAFPTLVTDGVRVEDCGGPSPNRLVAGPRVHVLLDYFISTGTVSVTAALYGLAAEGSSILTSAPKWVYIGSLNSGNSLTVNTSKWSPAASTISYSEAFNYSGQQFTRFKTRVIVAGSNDLVTTHIGFELA